MKSPVEPETTDLSLITRREAIRRTAVALGIAITPSLLDGLVQAQTAGTARASSPAFLTAKQYETVAAIAERILPKTETPGAIDVGVPAFIDLMFGKYLLDDEKQALSAGLS